MLDAFFNTGVAAPTVNLSPACDSGPDFVAQHILGNLSLEVLNKEWPLRPRAYQTHLPLQDIPKLRPFVDVKFSQNSPPSCHTWIIRIRENGTRFRFGIGPHRPKLMHEK